MRCCDHCNESLVTPEGSRQIDAFLDRATGALTSEEILLFLDRYDLTHRKAAQILGIGEKNISRWLNGRQRVSASMSSYIRVLIAHPAAFETLKNKQWENPARSQSFPTEKRQPDAAEKEIIKLVDYKTLHKIGLVPNTRKVSERRTAICQLTRVPDLITLKKEYDANPKKIAAFKDTKQKYNALNGGLWIELGERAARALPTAPFSREKLEGLIEELRQLTRHEPHTVFAEVQKKLASTGVALVIIPKLEGSAFRGCTRLLHPAKAMIAHSLKFKTASQFWRVLFHEIAHLILHINSPEDCFDEYDTQSDDPREREADEWADQTLVYTDKLTAFDARHPKPSIWDLARFAQDLETSPAIIAEIINQNRGEEIFNFGYLRKEGLFPSISAEAAEKMWQPSRDLIINSEATS